MLEKLMAQQVH